MRKKKCMVLLAGLVGAMCLFGGCSTKPEVPVEIGGEAEEGGDMENIGYLPTEAGYMSAGVWQTVETQEDIVLTVGMVGEDNDFRKKIDCFVQEHPEYKVEVQLYDTVSLEEDPFTQLKIEVASGKGPDVINFGSNYSESVAAAKLTDDLFEYMEGDETFQKEDYFENIFEAFAVDGKLAAVPDSFIISTAVGLKQYYDTIENWDFDALSEVYNRYCEDHILYPGESKRDVFGFLCTGAIGQYLDWQTVECHFDSKEFAAMMQFADRFPEQMVYSEDMKLRTLFAEGTALLYRTSISGVWSTGLNREMYLGQELVYLGYPVTGNVAESGNIVLGINCNSKQKTESWEFIKYFLSEAYQEEYAGNLPLHRGALQQRIEAAGQIIYTEKNGEKVPVVKERYFEGEDPVQLAAITKEDADTLYGLIESVHITANVDYALYNIVLEEVQAYFEGSKGLEDTVDVIQRRMKIAMAEKAR